MSVTVCIPVWNTTTYLFDALDSVAAQTVEATEVLVIDDGSRMPFFLTEASDVSGLRGEYRIIRTSHRGPANAWNTGLMNSNCDWFLPLASDDWLDPKFIEKCLDATGLKTDVVVPSMQEQGASGTRYLPGPVPLAMEKISNHFPYCAFFWTDFLRSLGGWHGQLALYPDWGMWIDVLQRDAKVVFAPEALVNYRVHPDQHSASLTIDQHRDEVERVHRFFP